MSTSVNSFSALRSGHFAKGRELYLGPVLPRHRPVGAMTTAMLSYLPCGSAVRAGH